MARAILRAKFRACFGEPHSSAGGWYGRVAHSPDGVSWAAVPDSGFGFGGGGLSGIAYGDGRFVAVGLLGRMAYSIVPQETKIWLCYMKWKISTDDCAALNKQ